MQGSLTHLSHADFKYFENAFKDYSNAQSKDITFRNLREIIISFKKFGKNIVQTCLEKIIKRLASQNEDEVYVGYRDYCEYLQFIALEHDKYLNERDPEIKYLFELLSLGESSIYKKKIVEVIKDFELPINIDEFFAPIGKKEEIFFEDFCYLFKSTGESGEILMNTFASSFYKINTNE